MQYLAAHVSTQAAQIEFENHLKLSIPKLNGTLYYDRLPVPHIDSASYVTAAANTFHLHISKFSLAESGSLREPPPFENSRRLFERFLVEGFTTSSQPLVCFWQARLPSECSRLCKHDVVIDSDELCAFT